MVVGWFSGGWVVGWFSGDWWLGGCDFASLGGVALVTVLGVCRFWVVGWRFLCFSVLFGVGII